MDQETAFEMDRFITEHRSQILEELKFVPMYRDASKDILIVVHDQLHYLRNCIESIEKHTTNYHLYIWDNSSKEPTKEYLKELMYRQPSNGVTVVSVDVNEGFVGPNNNLAALGDGEYLVLLNSDTKVFDGWDRGMIGFLQNNSDYAQVGYLGSLLDDTGKGGYGAWGSEIDYVCGFCSCFSRATYEQYGLFDPQLRFAYCEDADFSIRLTEAGRKIHALHLMLCHHYENKTIRTVQKEGEVDVEKTFNENHAYMARKWSDYLANRRVGLRMKQIDSGFDISANRH
jgi:GT2 family glycosyltransferase